MPKSVNISVVKELKTMLYNKIMDIIGGYLYYL